MDRCIFASMIQQLDTSEIDQSLGGIILLVRLWQSINIKSHDIDNLNCSCWMSSYQLGQILEMEWPMCNYDDESFNNRHCHLRKNIPRESRSGFSGILQSPIFSSQCKELKLSWLLVDKQTHREEYSWCLWASIRGNSGRHVGHDWIYQKLPLLQRGQTQFPSVDTFDFINVLIWRKYICCHSHRCKVHPSGITAKFEQELGTNIPNQTGILSKFFRHFLISVDCLEVGDASTEEKNIEGDSSV